MGEERGIGTAGGGRWTFKGVAYPTRSGMCRARRERYVALLDEGLNFTQAARILIADRPGAGDSIRAIARRLGRPASTVSREVRRNSDPGAGGYGPYRAQQAAADRRKRPKARKAVSVQ